MAALGLGQSYRFTEGLRADLQEEFNQLERGAKRSLNDWAEQMAISVTKKATVTPQPFLALSGDVGDMSYLHWEILKFKLIERGCKIDPLARNRSNWSVCKPN